MQKIFFFLFSITLTTLTVSCSDDFIDKGLLGELEETNFMTSQTDAVLATNAAYNVLRDWAYHFTYPIQDIMSDDTRKGSNPTDQAGNVDLYDNFTFSPANDLLLNWYNSLYVGIKRANVVIERAPAIAMDQALKTRLIAETRFLRGLHYFYLVRGFGGVPLVTSLDPDIRQPRASVEEVYSLILEDLNFAAENLPERSEYAPEDLGRATKGAAKSLLARVYLTRRDFTNAEKFALEVINSGQYSLDPDYGHTFSKAGEFNEESVFEIGAIRGPNREDGGHQYGNTQGVRGTPNKGWGFNRPTPDFMNSFEPGDPRLDATVIFLGETLDGVTISGDGATPDVVLDSNGDTLEIEVYNQKVWRPGVSDQDNWDFNVKVIRYADVLLMAAEALNENGQPAQALIYLNQVRARARGGNAGVLPDITETGQAALRQIIYDERRHELGLEQHRYWDLLRTGRAEAELEVLGWQAGKNELLPIPQGEIDVTEGAIEQNPGW